MKVIAIIGAGQIGSRHLEGLSKINIPIRVEVVDPSSSSIDVAIKRLEEANHSSNIREVRFRKSIEELPEVIDFAILSTSADIRACVLKKLLSRCIVKNLLLEKVLFQKLEDYAEIAQLLNQLGVMTWVNHPRRLFPFYHELKTRLAKSTMLSYQVQGGAWGLACNGLHLLDHLAFLSGGDGLEVFSDGLDRRIQRSKREGFVEFSGLLHGRLGGNPFAIFCHEAPSPMLITICADNETLVIDEGYGFVRMSSKEGGWKWEQREERIIRFQSELTSRVVEEVIATGMCDLPSYAEAVKLHFPFLRCLIAHLEKTKNIKYACCPIT